MRPLIGRKQGLARRRRLNGSINRRRAREKRAPTSMSRRLGRCASASSCIGQACGIVAADCFATSVFEPTLLREHDRSTWLYITEGPRPHRACHDNAATSRVQVGHGAAYGQSNKTDVLRGTLVPATLCMHCATTGSREGCVRGLSGDTLCGDRAGVAASP